MLNIPLMQGNIEKKDIEELVTFLQTTDRFTNGPKVREFEKAWSNWLSPSEPMYSLFVNSGASANFMTLAAVRELYGEGEVLVSPIGWSSDISSIFAAGFLWILTGIPWQWTQSRHYQRLQTGLERYCSRMYWDIMA